MDEPAAPAVPADPPEADLPDRLGESVRVDEARPIKIDGDETKSSERNVANETSDDRSTEPPEENETDLSESNLSESSKVDKGPSDFGKVERSGADDEREESPRSKIERIKASDETETLELTKMDDFEISELTGTDDSRTTRLTQANDIGASELPETNDLGTSESTETNDLVTSEFIESNDLGTSESTETTDLGTSEIPETNDLGSSKLLETNNLGTSKTPETNDLETPELPETNNLGTSDIPETNKLETSELTETETNDLGKSELPETNDLGSSELPVTNDIETSELPTINNLGTTELPEINNLGTSELHETNNLETSELIESNDLGTSELIESNDLGTSELIETNDLRPSELTETNDLRPSELAETNDLRLSELTETNDLGTSEFSETNNLGTSELTEINNLGTSDLSETNIYDTDNNLNTSEMDTHETDGLESLTLMETEILDTSDENKAKIMESDKIESPEINDESKVLEMVRDTVEMDPVDTTTPEESEREKLEINDDIDKNEENEAEAMESMEVNESEAMEDISSDIKERNSDDNLIDKTMEENAQVTDPFDDILEGEPNESVSDTQEHPECINNDSEIDNCVLDDEHAQIMDDCDNAHIADLDQGQGADEEICLLPDTEREITEADKLKALATKKTVDNSINVFDMLKEKDLSENTNFKVDDTNIVSEESAEVAELTEDRDQSIEHSVEEDIDEVESMRELPDGEKDAEDEHIIEETIDPDDIQEINKIDQTCITCTESKECHYRVLIDNEIKYICSKHCVDNFQEANSNKYKISHKKVIVSEVIPIVYVCFNCKEEKKCYYRFTCDEDIKMLCQEGCLQAMISENVDKYKLRRKKKFVSEITETEATCHICSETKSCVYETLIDGINKYLCSNDCFESLQKTQPNVFRLRKKKFTKPKQPMLKLKVITNATDKYLDEGNKIIAKTPKQAEEARLDREKSFYRKCAQCEEPTITNEKNLSWETMDFCDESCLGKYQNTHGLHCANCKNTVSMISLGKYCVRFGYDIRQFCCSTCLDEFKKGLKICCYCQRDISSGYEGFLAPVGDQGQFKDFCSQYCVEKFDQMSKHPVPPPIWAQCAVCSKEKLTQVEVVIDGKNTLRLCSEPCFAAFKFVNNVFPDQCQWCRKYFERKSAESYTIYSDKTAHCFCSKTCMNVYISNSRHIVPCNWCKVKKYNFDMIKKSHENGQSMMMCSLNCLTLYQVSVNAVSSRKKKCDFCKRHSQAQYHLTMSDATVRNFCSYQCVMSFQRQYSKSPVILEGDSQTKRAFPTGIPRRTYNYQKNNVKPTTKKTITRTSGLPIISNVQSLARPPSPTATSQVSGHATRAKSKRLMDKAPSPPPAEPPKPATPPPPPPPQIYNHVVFKPAPAKPVRNIGTLTKPLSVTKGVTCKPHMVTKEVQTDDYLQRRILIPIPVPIYVPTPMAMYSLPFPVPVPIPLPIPVPVFIPTTRNSANGIMKEIKKIHDKMPTDPFEAELLMMAEMVAGDKKKCESDSDSDEENGDGFSPDAMNTGNSAFGEDMLQMALKLATEYDEPAVDLESAMTASTITPSSHPTIPGLDENNPMHHHQLMLLEQQRVAAVASAAANSVSRKRSAQGNASPVNATTVARSSKRSRRTVEPPPPTHHAPPEPPREPQEKPDANMCLKYTFGVNAWKQWVMTKNAEMEKSTIRRKPFKSEILQLTADELNYSLCLFVKEVRKPNGSEYAPDTIYYLVLGIQQYLFENGRIDNIFTDTYYEKFTECLDEVARKFSVLYNDSQYIVTRVEEEHLWESKQLGAHSPHVLLSTLMFFNTKHFNLVTVDEHMQLSFSHIMKHWKRNPNQPGATKIPGARNVLLRFYPPQSALEANSRKKKVYEQQENEENPLRCPVKLYEFYISKCPESVKTRNDVFYLMPERSCVPDSPVWYSTQALGREPLSKMLHRVKMVKEINIALLTS